MQTNVISLFVVETNSFAECTLHVTKCVGLARIFSYRYPVVFEADLRTRKSKFKQSFHTEESSTYHCALEELWRARVCANLNVIMINKRYLIVYLGPKQTLSRNHY